MRVQLPDGNWGTFPDDMSQADVETELARLYPPQMEGWGRLPAMAGSYLTKGALAGTGAIGDLQDLGQRVANRYLFDPIRHAVGLTDPVTPRTLNGTEMFYPGAAGRSVQQLFPGASPEQLPQYLAANRDWLGSAPMPASPLSSTSLVGAGRDIGAVDRPDLQPQNPGERYLAAGAEGVGGMLPYLPLAVGGAVANAVRATPSLLSTTIRSGIQGAAGGVGGEAAADLTGSTNPWVRAAGNVLGMVGATGLLGAGSRAVNAVQGATTPVTQAYRDLNITPSLAGDVTGSPVLQQIQTFASKAPGGAGRIQAQSEKAIGQWGDAVEQTASNLGTSRTAQQAGDALQMEGKSWLNNFANDSKTAWDNVDMHIPSATPTPVTNYATTLTNIRNSMPGAPATADVLQSPLSRQLLDSLTADIQKGPLTWQDVRAIRTRIGEKLAEPQLVGDTSYGELKRLYGALSQDIENVAATRGPAAQQALTDASDLTRSGHDFIEGTLSKVLRGDQIAPERAADVAINSGRSGGTFLQDIRDQMPGAADELAAYKLRDMAAARAAQQNATTSRLSPGSFLTDHANLSSEAAAALFPDPYTAKRLSDLATVAASMRGTEKYLNTSNTATANFIGSALSPMAAYSTYSGGGGLLNTVAAALAPWATGQLAARATSTPALTGLLAAPGAAVSPASRYLAGGALYPTLRGLLTP